MALRETIRSFETFTSQVSIMYVKNQQDFTMQWIQKWINRNKNQIWGAHVFPIWRSNLSNQWTRLVMMHCENNLSKYPSSIIILYYYHTVIKIRIWSWQDMVSHDKIFIINACVCEVCNSMHSNFSGLWHLDLSCSSFPKPNPNAAQPICAHFWLVKCLGMGAWAQEALF